MLDEKSMEAYSNIHLQSRFKFSPLYADWILKNLIQKNKILL